MKAARACLWLLRFEIRIVFAGSVRMSSRNFDFALFFLHESSFVCLDFPDHKYIYGFILNRNHYFINQVAVL